MTTLNKTNTTGLGSTIISILFLLVVNNIFGFLTWAAYQVAAVNSGLVPSVSLIAGLGFWNMWTFMICIPIVFKVMFQSSVETEAKAKEAANVSKLYNDLLKTNYAVVPPNYGDDKKNKLDS